jgi:predicted PurR-regulated permease PerM
MSETDEARAPEPRRRESRSQRAFRGAIAVLAVVAFSALLWQLRPVLLLLFAATLVAIVLDGITRAICRHLPVHRGVALGVSALIVFGGMVGIFYLFGAELAAQVNHLVELIPGGWQDLSDRVGEHRLNDAVERLTPSGSNIFSIVQSILSFVSGMLSATMLAMLGGVFLATQPQTYRTGFRMILPQSWEARADETMHELGVALRRFIRGQLISMAFVGTTIFIGMWAIGAPSPLALAVIAAILGFIPVIGPLMAAAPGVLVGLTMGGEAIWQVILIYFVVQQIDGNLVNAIVMRHSVKIPPAVTMFALFAIGVTFGPAGLILGGPITVLVFVLVRKLWVEGRLGKTIED